MLVCACDDIDVCLASMEIFAEMVVTDEKDFVEMETLATSVGRIMFGIMVLRKRQALEESTPETV